MPNSSRRDFLKTSGLVATALLTTGSQPISAAPALATSPTGHESKADIVIVGASLGGVAAALAAARMGRTVILTEETNWIGGQATTQAVPLDEHPWVEKFGRNRSYHQFRTGIRDYYRRNFPLIEAARRDSTLNPGAGWVSGLCFEPRCGIAVLMEMLAPHLSAGRITLLMRHRPLAVAMEGDIARAVTVRDEIGGEERVLHGGYVLDATDLGELLPLANVEHVVGAESQAETGEPNARPDGSAPREQMAFTHTLALEYRPGEMHTIAKPAEYDRWKSRIMIPDFFGVERDYKNQPSDPSHYVTSQWNFRRLLCRQNFASGAFPSDVTSLMTANQYNGVLLGVSEADRRREMERARQLTLSVVYWLQTEAPNALERRTGFPGLRPRGDVMGTEDGLAQYPYIREAHRIRAEFTVLEQHFRTDLPPTRQGPVKYHDTVGVSGYRIDIHKPARGGAHGSITTANQGKHWTQQVPLGALIPVRVENLLPACKNLGVTAVTNGAFRVHAGEWSVGEAAGALAAHALNTGHSPRQIRNTPRFLADFQRELVKQGFELDWPEPLVAYSYFSYHDVELHDLDRFYFGEAWRRA